LVTKTATDLEKAFDLYFVAMRECARPGCYWALLHMVVALPDVCAGLESPASAARYMAWCDENFPNIGPLTSGDRYQMRNAVLHQGTTLPSAKNPKYMPQYVSISFVEPGENGAELHGLVQQDKQRGGKNLTVNIAILADETAAAMRHWFGLVECSPVRNAPVAASLSNIARKQLKVSRVPIAPPELPPELKVYITIPHPTTSST